MIFRKIKNRLKENLTKDGKLVIEAIQFVITLTAYNTLLIIFLFVYTVFLK